MEIDQELYKLSCINKMGKQYTRKWKSIKEQYAVRLDRGPVHKPIAYTFHDYSHHCFDIYKIVDKAILFKPSLSEQEWFILNTAILLHDFSMTFDNFDRLIHSKQSAEWLLDQMEKDTVLKKNLNPSEAEAIALIIQAHSDCKKNVNGTEEIEQYTLENEKMAEPMECGGAKNVHLQFLAAILRIADECDVTRDRVGDADFEGLKETDKEQKYSKEQWFQLKCFRSIVGKGELLELFVDDRYVQKHLGEMDEIEHRIKKVVMKIRKQLIYVRKKVIDNPEYMAMFQLRKVVIRSEVLSDEYVNKINDERLTEEESIEVSVPVLNVDLANKISAKIDGNDTIWVPGDYIVTDEHCEKDWIDLRDIVVDKAISEEIIQEIASKINEEYGNSQTPPIIVGMEDNGLILASQIASRLGYPFTYIIPKNYSWGKSSLKERFVDFAPYDNIIIITDAVATFQTMGRTCEEYKILDKVCQIYTVLYRSPYNESFFHKDTEKLMKKMTACCDKYPIYVHSRKKCPDNKNGKCNALNK